MSNTSGNKSTTWKKSNEPILCYDCGSMACAQAEIGYGVQWYCFVCLMESRNDTEFEEDESLQVCHEQLKIQSERY